MEPVEPVEPEPSTRSAEPDPDGEPETDLELDAEPEDELADPTRKSWTPRTEPARLCTPRAEANVPDLDDLPDPEDLAYIDDDDATPGPTGDQRRPADD